VWPGGLWQGQEPPGQYKQTNLSRDRQHAYPFFCPSFANVTPIVGEPFQIRSWNIRQNMRSHGMLCVVHISKEGVLC
jgi:hypothetical protein